MSMLLLVILIVVLIWYIVFSLKAKLAETKLAKIEAKLAETKLEVVNDLYELMNLESKMEEDRLTSLTKMGDVELHEKLFYFIEQVEQAHETKDILKFRICYEGQILCIFEMTKRVSLLSIPDDILERFSSILQDVINSESGNNLVTALARRAATEGLLRLKMARSVNLV
jgi:hypothetical protein